jgi:hypothetical protein
MFCVCLFTAFEYLVMVSCLSEKQACLGKVPSDMVIQGSSIDMSSNDGGQ